MAPTWLIELESSPPTAPLYLAELSRSSWYWSRNVEMAKRFASEDDARMFLYRIVEAEVRIVEHSTDTPTE